MKKNPHLLVCAVNKWGGYFYSFFSLYTVLHVMQEQAKEEALRY